MWMASHPWIALKSGLHDFIVEQAGFKSSFHGIVVNPAILHDIVGEDGGVRCRLQEMFQLHLLVLAPHLVVTINDGFLGDDGKAPFVLSFINLICVLMEVITCASLEYLFNLKSDLMTNKWLWEELYKTVLSRICCSPSRTWSSPPPSSPPAQNGSHRTPGNRNKNDENAWEESQKWPLSRT